jgi:4-diphosphocytidyl-2-C-methyl-D-erythritol kinase
MNDFEKHLFVKYPLLAQLKLQLKGMGAIYTAMSGSGSTMFGIFEKEVDDLTSKLPSEYKVWQERIER